MSRDAHIAMTVSTMFEVDKTIRCLVIALLLLIRYVTLLPWPLTFWLWSVVIHGGSRGQPPSLKIFLPIYCSAFNCLSSGINILAGGRPLPPEILPPSDLPSPVNGILWEMTELVTQERIALGSSNFVEGFTTWPAMYDHWAKSKGQRSRSQSHVTYLQQ